MRTLTVTLAVIALGVSTSASATVYTGTLVPPYESSIYEPVFEGGTAYAVSFRSSEPLTISELTFGTDFTDILYNDDGSILDTDDQIEVYDVPLSINTPDLVAGRLTTPSSVTSYSADGHVHEVEIYSDDNFTENAAVDSLSYYIFTISSVPEPATWALMLMGFGLVGAVARRRQVAC